jgi:hypothetical protein
LIPKIQFDENFGYVFYLIVAVQANRTPVESTSHSTSHSITPPPSATQPFLAGPSLLVLSHVAPEVDRQPLSAADTVDAARLRNQQAEKLISSLTSLHFMLSNELVT